MTRRKPSPRPPLSRRSGKSHAARLAAEAIASAGGKVLMIGAAQSIEYTSDGAGGFKTKVVAYAAGGRGAG